MAEFQATHRYARISARKVQPFADLIRGKTAEQGLETLRYVPNRGARFLEKVLKSAIANAENRNVRNVEKLIITEVRINCGPMFKRIQPRARGMAYLIRRRTAHIHVAVDAPGY